MWDDTIVALATAPGRGAIAVVRLSGPDAFRIAERHITPWPISPRTAELCEVSEKSRRLDQAIVTTFIAPASFTGEDVVEISTHGGNVVPASIVAALISSGARQALPGEFTRRAVLNGKLDILQAEAVGDLIDARSRAMQNVALSQLDGGLSRRLVALRDELIHLEALIAYDIDFPEEDDGPIAPRRIDEAARRSIDALEALLATAAVGEIIREGAVIAIVGPPNAGKSSLFNALLGHSRAIVTELPGTTRDALEAVVDTGRWPLRLVDTAGLRETDDRIEKLGIEMSNRYVTAAHVVLACAEDERGLRDTVAAVRALSDAAVIGVGTKSDLVPHGYQVTDLGLYTWLAVSTELGSGLPELIARIEQSLVSSHAEPGGDLPVLTRTRHRHAIALARAELQLFQSGWKEESLPATVASVHLRTAAAALEELIGSIDVDDVFDRVFSSFCVGK
ncbi:MAG TPA: tRNA uridine-5-carboxymethylaminomethyl(34) synthesis GTPase MnmE [Gemmatimonadaceae bacterium]|nr:tRNA uridine-5-carboxymethylaminomethyl(34) synthesis GTPase MnmE [Gemmatimonadaceae bacterium]